MKVDFFTDGSIFSSSTSSSSNCMRDSSLIGSEILLATAADGFVGATAATEEEGEIHSSLFNHRADDDWFGIIPIGKQGKSRTSSNRLDDDGDELDEEDDAAIVAAEVAEEDDDFLDC